MSTDRRKEKDDSLISNKGIEAITGLSRSRINLLADAGRFGKVTWKTVRGKAVRYYEKEAVERFERQRQIRQVLDLEGMTKTDAQLRALEQVIKDYF